MSHALLMCQTEGKLASVIKRCPKNTTHQKQTPTSSKAPTSSYELQPLHIWMSLNKQLDHRSPVCHRPCSTNLLQHEACSLQHLRKPRQCVRNKIRQASGDDLERIARKAMKGPPHVTPAVNARLHGLRHQKIVPGNPQRQGDFASARHTTAIVYRQPVMLRPYRAIHPFQACRQALFAKQLSLHGNALQQACKQHTA